MSARAQIDDDNAEARSMAVVDIGSNSVRLVIFRIVGGASFAILNERVDAGLGRDMSETGVLSKDGRKRALGGIERFRTLIEGRGVSDVAAVATAAVREASDGAEFCKEAQKALGVQPRVLSGAEEARISALGVLAGERRAQGVVGDLGGSSLELAAIKSGQVKWGVSMPAGPLALTNNEEGDKQGKLRKRIDSLFDDAKVDRYKRFDTLYLVGGSWRNLAVAEMHRTGHPISVIQGFEMSGEAAKALAVRAAREGAGYLSQVPGVSSRRLETLPIAGMVLERLISRLKVQRVVASAYGLREGVVYELMTDEEREADPLICGMAALARRFGADPELGRALQNWLEPIRPAIGEAFGEETDRRLFAAACRMADISGWRHPDHRAQLSFDEILAAPIGGLAHRERAFLARVVSCRYDGNHAYESEDVTRLLSPRAQGAAFRLGLALRLACTLSGRAHELLDGVKLTMKSRALILTASPARRRLVNELVQKRLQRLAEACNLGAQIAED